MGNHRPFDSGYRERPTISKEQNFLRGVAEISPFLLAPEQAYFGL